MSVSARDEQRANRRYLVKWKMALALPGLIAENSIQGYLSDISLTGATALIEQNLPAKTSVDLIFVIPPKLSGDKPQTVQVNAQVIYCVLGNAGLFRAGLHFVQFMGQGMLTLEQELARRIPLGY